MSAQEKEYIEVFKAEALEIYDSLSHNIVLLEKRPNNEATVDELFRLMHNLKANANAIGYKGIGDIAHKLETIFSAIRDKQVEFKGDVVTVAFDGTDLLGLMIDNIENKEFDGGDPAVSKNINLVLDDIEKGILPNRNIERVYTSQNIALSDLVSIHIRKLDNLLNLVGELMIDRDRIIAISAELDNDSLNAVAAHLYRITNAIQQSVMDVRLIAIGGLFNKFPRIVRDVASGEDKEVNLVLSGQEIKIDRNILQIITDALLHLVRNAINHGIERPEERKKKDKPAEGAIRLSASSDKNKVIIIVEDDGRGLDPNLILRHAVEQEYVSADKAAEVSKEEIYQYIFEPGFSLSEKITEISGRGVGLDVVKSAIDSIGGKIAVETKKDKGTKFTLTLPTSIAVKGALLFEVEKTPYAIPLTHTDSVVVLRKEHIHQVGPTLMADIKGETLPLVNLQEVFNSSAAFTLETLREGLYGNFYNVVVVSHSNKKLGLIVERLLHQQDIVVKPLQKPVEQNEFFGGVTLLGSGEVCLVLDIPALTRRLSPKAGTTNEQLLV